MDYHTRSQALIKKDDEEILALKIQELTVETKEFQSSIKETRGICSDIKIMLQQICKKLGLDEGNERSVPSSTLDFSHDVPSSSPFFDVSLSCNSGSKDESMHALPTEGNEFFTPLMLIKEIEEAAFSEVKIGDDFQEIEKIKDEFVEVCKESNLEESGDFSKDHSIQEVQESQHLQEEVINKINEVVDDLRDSYEINDQAHRAEQHPRIPVSHQDNEFGNKTIGSHPFQIDYRKDVEVESIRTSIEVFQRVADASANQQFGVLNSSTGPKVGKESLALEAVGITCAVSLSFKTQKHKILLKIMILIWKWYYKDTWKERLMEHPGMWRIEWKIAWARSKECL